MHFLADTPSGSSPQQQASQQQQQQLQQVTHQLASSTLDSPVAAGTANSSSGSGGSSSSSRLLLTASGESLYLWDLVAGQLLQQTAPLPVLKSGAAFAAAFAGHSNTAKQQQHQQPPGSSSVHANSQAGQSGPNVQDSSSRGSAADLGTDNREDGFEEPPASYVFGVSVCPETNWAAATCSDGMLRLWDASRQALTEVAAVQVCCLPACLVMTCVCVVGLWSRHPAVCPLPCVVPVAPLTYLSTHTHSSHLRCARASHMTHTPVSVHRLHVCVGRAVACRRMQARWAALCHGCRASRCVCPASARRGSWRCRMCACWGDPCCSSSWRDLCTMLCGWWRSRLLLAAVLLLVAM